MNIVLTGAADGLGKEIALLLKEHNLILVDYAEAKLKEVAKLVKSKQKYVCDLTSAEEVEQTTAQILKKNKNQRMAGISLSAFFPEMRGTVQAASPLHAKYHN